MYTRIYKSIRYFSRIETNEHKLLRGHGKHVTAYSSKESTS